MMTSLKILVRFLTFPLFPSHGGLKSWLVWPKVERSNTKYTAEVLWVGSSIKTSARPG